MTQAPTPDYAAGTLADVLPAVAHAMGLPGFESRLELAPADHVIVLLVDGLGAISLAEHQADAPVLASMSGVSIAAGFPSTTAVGLASLGVGVPPGTHGVIGTLFAVPEWGGILAPLRWGSEPNPVATQPEATVFERMSRAGIASSAVGAGKYRGSGLTRAVLRGAEYLVADTRAELAKRTAIALQAAGPAMAYVYWAELDKAGHVHGVGSNQWLAELARVDDLVGRLLAALPAGGLLHVTSDHGMVDTPPDAARSIEGNLLTDVLTVAGEPRARHIYVRHGAVDDVAATWREVLADRAWVLTRAEAIAAGWFGAIDPDLADRIGDLVVAARGNLRLISDVDARLSGMRGQHGSLTPTELMVPLLTGGR